MPDDPRLGIRALFDSLVTRITKGTNPALVELEAVDTMGRLQLGKKFMGDENAKIFAFLKTLTGGQPNFKLPMLPPSSDMTPKPQPFAQM